MGCGYSVSLDVSPVRTTTTNLSMPPLQNRIESLDQFRGYTVAGMFLVNYLSGFWAAPFVCHHHNTYCSYADTIMPAFFLRSASQCGSALAAGNMSRAWVALTGTW